MHSGCSHSLPPLISRSPPSTPPRPFCDFWLSVSEFAQGLGWSRVGSPGPLFCFHCIFSVLATELFELEALFRSVFCKYFPAFQVVSLPLLPLLCRNFLAANSLCLFSAFKVKGKALPRPMSWNFPFSSSSFTVSDLHVGILSI